MKMSETYNELASDAESFSIEIKNEDIDEEIESKCDMNTIQEVDESIRKNERIYKQSEAITQSFKEEDLQNLLLYYMKQTFESRKKNSITADETSQSSDREKNDYYSLSTDYDTEEDEPPSKTLPSGRNLKCEHCSKILRGTHSLKNHCKRKHGDHMDKHVLCDKCPTRFYTDFEFNRHYQTHFSIKNFLCHLCSKRFFQKSSLDLHLRYHKNDRRYECETCQKMFFTNNHLKRHYLTHTNRKDFRCEPCGRSFRYKDHLRRHIQSVHIGERSHFCKECNRAFMYLSQLKFHERSHRNEPNQCSNCKKVFKKRISLKLHQKYCKKKLENKNKELPLNCSL